LAGWPVASLPSANNFWLMPREALEHAAWRGGAPGDGFKTVNTTMNAKYSKYAGAVLGAVALAGTAAGEAPRFSGAFRPLTAAAAANTKAIAGVILRDAESNLLCQNLRKEGFGTGNAAGGNYVANAASRDLILAPGSAQSACFGFEGAIAGLNKGRLYRRDVRLADHAVRGNPAGKTAKFNVFQDVKSGRWAKWVTIHYPDGSIKERRVWKGKTVEASAKKAEMAGDQALLGAAAATRATFLNNTLVPITEAGSAYDSDRRLFSTTHSAVNLTRASVHAYDAPLRNADFFPSLVATDPEVGDARNAAKDDVAPSAQAVEPETDKWAARAARWASRIKKWIDRIKTLISIFKTILGLLG
jgi:hypothetical protein